MAYQPFDLTGKVALVTGGNRGIGLGMADAMAQAGADIVIWGTKADRNEEAVEQLRSHGIKAMAQQVNVADEQAVNTAFAELLKEMGKVDAVFANAGIGGGAKSFHEMSTETWRRVLSVNLDGVFFTLRAAAGHMAERGEGGSLVGISSLSAVDGAPRNQAYAATKGAILPMMRACAVEYARYGVRANTILPGWVATEMTTTAQASDNFNDKVIKRVPSRRWGQPEDFGGIAVYLASDASSYHSGDEFLIDGGYAVY